MKKKTRFYGVNEIGHITIDKKNIVHSDVFIEMKAQGLENKSEMDLVMIFSKEQVIEMYDRVINSIIYSKEQVQ